MTHHRCRLRSCHLPLTAFTGFALGVPEARRRKLWREGKRRNQGGRAEKTTTRAAGYRQLDFKGCPSARSPPRSPQLSRRQREKRSTSNKIRVQRLINNITQNPHHPLPAATGFAHFRSFASHSRRSLLSSSLEHCPPISSRADSPSTRRPIPPFFFHKKKWLCRRLKPGTCTALVAS